VEDVLVSDGRYVLVLPDRDAAEEAAEEATERFCLGEQPRIVRDALAGEDDAADAQWLVVIENPYQELAPEAIEEFAGEYDGWREAE
jgi:hypothetical protein